MASIETSNDRARWTALYVLCAGMLMIVLDMTIVNVALPSIQDDLGFSQSGLAWVVNAYLIAFGGLLLLAGRLGDLLGQRRVFLAGLAVFTFASLACALAPSEGVLVGARFVQGIGGALTSAVTLGMIVTLFPEPKEQAKALGVYGFVASGGGSVGLLLGGVLTDALDWHWIFLINVPVGVVTAYLAVRLVEDRPGLGAGAGAGADLPGAVLLTGGLMLFVWSVLGVEQAGWAAPRTLVGIAVSVALIAVFLRRQAVVETPLMPLRLLRSPSVMGANAVQALIVVGMFGTFFLGALYLQRVLGYDPLQVGLAFLPSCLAMGVCSLRLSEPLAARFGGQRLLLASLVPIGLALVLLVFTPVDGDYWLHVLPAMVLQGVGAGLGFPVIVGLAMSGAESQDAGLASGLVNTASQIGAGLGLALLATLATERTDALGGDSSLAALNGGYHLAYVVAAALLGVAFVLAATLLKSAARTAHDLRRSVVSTA